MSQNPVTQIIRIVLATFFLFWLLLFYRDGYSEEFAVPYGGSPYKNLADLDAGQILHLPTGLESTESKCWTPFQPPGSSILEKPTTI